MSASPVATAILLLLPFLVVSAALIAPLKFAGRRRHYERFGYLDTPFDAPPKAFGLQEYAVRRDGARGHFRGCVISNNPAFYSRERALERREDEQEGLPCEVCGRETETGLLSDDGPVFRERWQSLHVCFLPVKRTYLGCEAFCARHVPRDWDAEERPD